MSVDKEKARIIIKKLKEYHKNAVCELDYGTSFELLVSVILSAQCTDKRVNKVTPVLFNRYKNVYEMAEANNKELEEIIYSCGFYKNKANNIINASKEIVEKYNGVVPNTQEELMKLPGVGRKTANVVYSVAFKGDAIAVDTHVFRVSRRVGFSKATTPENVEKDLNKILDKNIWSMAHHLLIHQGRYVCQSRKPKCDICPIVKYCAYKKKILKGVGSE